MRTPSTRKQHIRKTNRYHTDVTDKEWRVIEPHLPAVNSTGRPRAWPMRAIINGIFYVMRAGAAAAVIERADSDDAFSFLRPAFGQPCPIFRSRHELASALRRILEDVRELSFAALAARLVSRRRECSGGTNPFRYSRGWILLSVDAKHTAEYAQHSDSRVAAANGNE